MISFKHKFIFIHIPRTGGTSIENSLLDYSEDGVDWMSYVAKGDDKVRKEIYDLVPSKKVMELCDKNNFDLSNENNSYKHLSYSNYKKILGDKINDFFIFSVIRNPYHRIASMYYGSCPYKKFNLEKMWKSRLRFLRADSYFNNCKDIFLLRHENLKKDWKSLLSKLDLPLSLPLKHLNKGMSTNFPKIDNGVRDYDALWDDINYGQKELKFMNNIFSDEIEEYGYQIKGEEKVGFNIKLDINRED